MFGRPRRRAAASAMPDYVRNSGSQPRRRRRGMFGRNGPSTSEALSLVGAFLQDQGAADGGGRLEYTKQGMFQNRRRREAEARQQELIGQLGLNGRDRAAFELTGQLPEAPKAPETFSTLTAEETQSLGLPEGSFQRNDVTGEIQSIRGQGGGVYNSDNVQSTFVDENGNLQFLRRDGTVENTGIRTRNPFQIVDIGGVPTGVNRQNAGVVPLATPEQVGQNQATINTTTSREATRLEAEEELPRLEAQSQYILDTVDQLLAHPGFDNRYGFTSLGGFLGAIPGTDAAGAGSLIKQVEGQVFLEAYEKLKGGGVITEIEGQKATQAIARMTDRGIHPDEARAAAAEFKKIIEDGLARKSRRAQDGVGAMNDQELGAAAADVLRQALAGLEQGL